jgi:5-oxoprolinase (ATP-hydrolysing)/N-methylhydantoinase A
MGSYGRDAEGRPFNDHLFQGGGQGASAHGDGKSALLYPTSAANVSVEMFESRTPLVVECKELIADSGGPGRHRGGLGQRVRMRLRRPSPNPVLVDFRPHGMLVSTPGLHGGLPGRRARAFVVEDGRVRAASATIGVAELRGTEERATIEIAGGSGFGDPGARPPAEIQADLDDGYITADGTAAYGAAVDRDGRVRR